MKLAAIFILVACVVGIAVLGVTLTPARRVLFSLECLATVVLSCGVGLCISRACTSAGWVLAEPPMVDPSSASKLVGLGAASIIGGVFLLLMRRAA